MARHTIIAHAEPAPRVSFDGDAWLAYVPIRRSSTIAVRDRDRMPPGSAAVLLNREHTYTDLLLPIDRDQLGMYEAIDGRRTIAEIAAKAGVGPSAARDLFERFWWYDQIVVDASGGIG